MEIDLFIDYNWFMQMTECLNIYSIFDVSEYNYWFEVAALVFLIFITTLFALKRKFPDPINKIFLIGMGVAMADVATDVAACILIENASPSNDIWNYCTNGLFYILQASFPVLLMAYVLYYSGRSFKKNKLYLLTLIPVAAFILIIITNPFTHWIFKMGTTEDGTYGFIHGPVFAVYYLTCACYVIVCSALSIVFRKDLDTRSFVTMNIIFGFVALAIVIQILVPSILLTGTAIAMSLLLGYATIADPSNNVDTISGTFNYNAFVSYLNHQAKEKLKRYYVMVTIKGISDISKDLGFIYGNEMFRKIGNFFNHLTKEKYVFRFFNSRFIILFRDKETQMEALYTIAGRFKEVWEINEQQFVLDANIVHFVNDGLFYTGEEFMQFINALNSSNKEEESNVFEADQAFFSRMKRDRDIVQSIGNALKSENGFYLVFQPIINMKTNVYERAEALLRLDDPELGNVGPSEFIPIAEKSGLASQIDKWVIDSACKFIRDNPQIKNLEINISSAEFFHNPASMFVKLIQSYDIDPSKICIEITESISTRYPEKTKEFMEKLKEIGISFAMDDFGTGYSNITKLMDQPFDFVKIDKSLLKNDRKVRQFLNANVSLFKGLNIPIILEGVETKEQVDLSKQLDVDYVQGYYFSKPVKAEYFLELISNSDTRNKRSTR